MSKFKFKERCVFCYTVLEQGRTKWCDRKCRRKGREVLRERSRIAIRSKARRNDLYAYGVAFDCDGNHVNGDAQMSARAAEEIERSKG